MLRRRLFIIASAPVEVIGCMLIGAWRYGVDACSNVRDAWREAK